MGFVKGSLKACLFIGFLFILKCVIAEEHGNEERKTYVVHLGQRQHDDPDEVSESHHRLMESVLESAEAARESILYNYKHGFSGFAARLTDSQAKKLSENPNVVQVSPNQKHQLTSTRLSDYLGLSPSLPKGLLHESNMGEDLVIGFVDSGIWPESPAFNDEGLGPIPKHWKGECVAGEEFDPAIHCNKKLVGGKYYLDKWDEKYPGTKVEDEVEYMSARGVLQHGSMVASIGASSFIPNTSLHGLAHGVMRGTAPKARVAMYKVMWDTSGGRTRTVDILRAVDDAIKDGVDVLSVSIAATSPFQPSNFPTAHLDLGSFYAVMKGIPYITGAANTGPEAYSVANVAPWMFTVAASTMDRSLYVDMTLGNNITFMGRAIYFSDRELTADLIYVEDMESNTASMKDKVVLTFVNDDLGVYTAFTTVYSSSGRGVIVARSTDLASDTVFQIPVIHVDHEVGSKILQYIRLSSSPMVKLSAGKTLTGYPIASQVSGYSSRGPSQVSPAILKPDIAAPGTWILGATPQTEDFQKRNKGMTFGSGTSFATPAIAGIVTLLKAIHPDWSPAALKSALMTTAWKTDPSGNPFFAEGSPRKLADPFDYGAGLVNVERCKDPGLVYDMNLDDYIHYFCAIGYNDTAITMITAKPTKCSTPLPSILDVNYPAITIPDLEKEVILTRTVTNVGPVDSVYRPVIEPPEGVKIVVEPETLVFNSSTKKLTYKVRVSTSHKSDTGYFFGSLSWTDGTRNVYIPVSVRTRVLIH